MQDSLHAVWASSVDFWSRAYALSQEELSSDSEPDSWKKLAPSEKQLNAIGTLSACRHLLDYGCGSGWASILAAKKGCTDITGVDVAPGSKSRAEWMAQKYGVSDRIRFLTIPEDWLRSMPTASFDGFFSSNVLDVVPEEISDEILKGAYHVLKPGSPVIISLNYYAEPKPDPERNRTVRDGKYLFVDGILRLACYTDDAWIQRFAPYFRLEKLVHYAWPNEQEERRRLFFLRRV